MRIGVLRLGGPVAAAVLSVLPSPGIATGETRGVDLRVVNTAGRTLAEFRQYTGPVTIKTNPNAKCFGQGTGGSGDRFRLGRSTGLGALKDAVPSAPALRPLSVTDAFADQGFGLGVCGIGGFLASGNAYWYLKRNHVGAQVSGSQLKLRQGDDVLWYRTPGYPPPPELALEAPARARPNVPFRVTVYSYGDDGSRDPVAGASVAGAAAPTNGAGRAIVTAPAGTHRLRATDSPAIPSNVVGVCVSANRSACPTAQGRVIAGSDLADRIAGTPGPDSVSARGGADEVDLRRGGSDKVRCGAGRDRVILARGDTDYRIAANCERVIRR